MNATDPQESVTVVESPIGYHPFSESAAPVELLLRVRRDPQWQQFDGSAGPLPESPVKSASSEETVTLVPYGTAKLRITAFPEIVRDS